MCNKTQSSFRLILQGLLFIGLLVCSLLAGSCSGSDCSLGGEPMLRFTFINSRTHAPVKLFDSLSVTALDTDTILINRDKHIDHISLPLSYTAPQTTFVLHYSRLLQDTIRLTHENSPHFISTDCGIAMFHKLTNITYTQILIDSIRLVNSDVNDYEKENYRIYYTPDK